MTSPLPCIIPHWPGLPANVGALSSVRAGGVSQGPYGDGQGGGGLNLGTHVGDEPAHVAANRARLAAILPAEPAWLSQVHGVVVADAGKLDGHVPDADASIAALPGAVCVVMTADCLPVLFCSTDGLVVGAAHAGWRGLANGVLQRTVASRASTWPTSMRWRAPCCCAMAWRKWREGNTAPSAMRRSFTRTGAMASREDRPA